MTQIQAFKGILFNPDKINDLYKVVCPPYDIISAEDQNRYYGLSQHNMVRLVLNKGSLDENLPDNRYSNAAQEFQKWQSDKILIQDKRPAIYLYEQKFTFGNKKFTRVGLFAALKLLEENSSVFPHEHTHAQPKVDRLKLIMKVKANLSPIFCIFSDKNKQIKKIAKVYQNKKPLFSFDDRDNIEQKFWRIEDKKIIAGLEKYLKDKNIFIADGHHRFEVACQYRDIMNSQAKKKDKNAAYNFVMIYLTDADARDNLILPYHRVIVKKDVDKEKLLSYIKEYFLVEKAKDKLGLQKFLDSNRGKSGAFGVYFRNDSYKLTLKDKAVFGQDLFAKYSAAIRKLDVVILQNLILDQLSLKEGDIAYTKDSLEAFKLVDRSDAAFAVILNPTTIKQLKDVVSGGIRMPQKSTYFYPKIPTGLVINRID